MILLTVNETVSMMVYLSLVFFCFTSLSFPPTSGTLDTLAPNHFLTDNGQTLVSAAQTFELGFFSPWNSSNRYVGIWFKNVPQQTPVWVANKNNPLSDSSGVLTITTTGNIVITNNRTNMILWSSNSSSIASNKTILHLLDSGNLVVKNREDDDNSGGNYLWQSFDYPCDTLIPGMKLGWNLRTGQEWYLTSWKSLQDPSSGDYILRVDRRGLPQLVLHQGSQQVIYRSAPWDGSRFGSDTELKQVHLVTVFNPIFVFDEENVYYTFENNDYNISRFVVNQSGLIEHFTLSQRRNQWLVIFTLQRDSCDTYEFCGPYSFCYINGQITSCRCPHGFKPRFPQDWGRQDWSAGCVRETPLNCSEKEGFRKFSKIKLPDTSYFLVMNRTTRNPVECEEACLSNCSCVAYAKTEINGCVVWFDDLLDIREYNNGGQDLYIRMSAFDLDKGFDNKSKRTEAIGLISIISGILLLGFISWCAFFKRTCKMRKALTTKTQDNPNYDTNQSILDEDLELPLFVLASISNATNNYSIGNKIGEGGFGPVYKGTLSTGQEIAVKRLSKNSNQGVIEFKNEVILILKLQHRNLVRLLGCCIHGQERMLIYEYMPNKSLDLFIFNQTRGTSLNWGNRIYIIVGIARGLLYLHRDSRLRIIHRDLKASNILLDSEMNPKISDFGLARTFRGEQSEENTNRVVGTYGYMSPEYAIDGLFSVKSDVFSFGVLVLEIVSGKKNRGFNHPDHDLNLLGHAWKLWNEGNPLKLLDHFMESSVPDFEVLRYIQVGLLCVQQRPEDRPTMSSALLMLDSENPMLPQPKQPGFYTERFLFDTNSSSIVKNTCASNEMTITMLHGR